MSYSPADLWLLENERACWREFVEESPYPSRDKVIARCSEPGWVAAYDHERCRAMWHNLHDSALVRECGQAIHRAGGLQAMQANYYMLCNFGGARVDAVLYSHLGASLRSEWNGVGDWLN